MKVFKFGGASVSTAERIKAVAGILQNHSTEQILVVVSAMGKTTNALEKVVAAFYDGDKEQALQQFEAIKQDHLAIEAVLMADADRATDVAVPLTDFFTEVEWMLHDKPVRSFAYYYDQVVCVGELLSTAIVANYMAAQKLRIHWLDVRDVMRTDGTFRDARIDWPFTLDKVTRQVGPLFAEHDLLLTQGFIGATDENESTTLGREGSDYTAAMFANMLAAESLTIWKDVQGVMNADPKLYPQAQWIEALSYREVIEMAYYGAQVIHPKTVKPLQNKSIPLYVRSFLAPAAAGTCIQQSATAALPPIIVYKEAQALIQLSSIDYSFVSEGLSAQVYTLFDELKFTSNLTQNAAITMLCVVDDVPSKIDAFAHQAAEAFYVTVTKNLTLLTIRHFTPEVVTALIAGRKILLQQQTPETVQFLLETII